VYSHCLFCGAALGRNEGLEHFPVGRRLAYDLAKGRLWVVCRRCERWNLTPLEVRWEAMEEAEGAYRKARLRAETENIGMAHLPEGLELVRVGRPPRLELAGWRYGDQFGRRRRKYFAYTSLGVLTPALPLLGSMNLGLGIAIVASGAVLTHTVLDIRHTRRNLNVPTVFLTDEAGAILPLTVHDTWSATLVPISASRDWYLSVRHHRRANLDTNRSTIRRPRAYEPEPVPAVLKGTVAFRALAALVPHANPLGATRRGIREAVRVIERSSDLEQLMYAAATSKRSGSVAVSSPLTRLPAPVRLALEMVLHEEDERRALEGDLAELEQRWREAEEIASIADGLLESPVIEARLEAIRQRDSA
jgi:hypothetical protein